MIANLQILRALAAWAVVLHHLRGSLGEVWRPLGETLVFASGVDLFFVISGFVMAHGAAKADVAPADFLRRRIARVAPLYWMVTLAIVLMLLAGLRPIGIADWSWRDLFHALIFFAAERSDGYPGPLLGVGWTLVYEAFFYALFALALTTRRHIPPAFAVIVALIALTALGFALQPEGFAARTYLAPILSEFALGVALALWRPNIGAGTAWATIALGALALPFGAAALAQIGGSDLITPGGPGALWRPIAFGLPAALIVCGALALARRGKDGGPEWLLNQGAASYALYLIHLPILQILGKAAGEGPAMILIALPALTYLAGWTHRRVEAPMTAWSNRALLVAQQVLKLSRQPKKKPPPPIYIPKISPPEGNRAQRGRRGEAANPSEARPL